MKSDVRLLMDYRGFVYLTLSNMKKFKVLIRVVKSINQSYWGSETVHREPVIEANDKSHVKEILLEMFPQFFQNGKIYERESKDQAQFFYVLIYELYAWEISAIQKGSWSCEGCGKDHENRYIAIPYKDYRDIDSEKEYCSKDCFNSHFISQYQTDGEMPDNMIFVKKDSPIYIYKITEKETGRCYIGKTKNEPVWRWWDHYKRSASPFGVYLRSKPISCFTFEVIDILPNTLNETQVFEIESKWILKYNSIESGFNTVISNKKTLEMHNQPEIDF